MRMRSRIGLILITWVTASATLLAGWPVLGAGCACASQPPAASATHCCCSPGDAPRACCAAEPACCSTSSTDEAVHCSCSSAAPEPAAPAAPARPAAGLDEQGPPAPFPAPVPGSVPTPAGCPLFGSLAHLAHAPPIDLIFSLQRLTC